MHQISERSINRRARLPRRARDVLPRPDRHRGGGVPRRPRAGREREIAPGGEVAGGNRDVPARRHREVAADDSEPGERQKREEEARQRAAL